MSDETLMSPEASPGGEKLRTGVRRVNNWPLYIGGIGVAGFMLMIALVMIDRANRQQAQDAEADKKGGDSSMFAKELAGGRQGFIIRRVGIFDAALVVIEAVLRSDSSIVQSGRDRMGQIDLPIFVL